MNLTTETLLPLTIYGQASGNYDGSSQDFFSDPVRAVGYYLGQGSIETVQIRVTGFTGRMTVQCSLQNDPVQAEWFDVYSYTHITTPVTEYHPVSLTGNFVWMRVRVELFDSGTIDNVLLVY